MNVSSKVKGKSRKENRVDEGAHTKVETPFQSCLKRHGEREPSSLARIRSLAPKLMILEFKGTRGFICLKKQVRRAHMSCSKPQGFLMRD